MIYINRFILFLSYGLFLMGLASMIWPINIFTQPKERLNIILLDVSASMELNNAHLLEKLNHFDPLKNSNEFIVAGYFSDHLGFISEDVVNTSTLDLKKYINSWLLGGDKWRNPLGNNSTNIESVIINCMEKWGEGFQLNICLVTDGKENSGSLKNCISILNKEKHQLQFLSYDHIPKDVYVKRLSSPKFFNLGEIIQIEIEILSTRLINDVPLRVEVNGEFLKEFNVDLNKGNNYISFSHKFKKEGNFKVAVSCGIEDQFEDNNKASIILKSKTMDNVLLVTKSKINFDFSNTQVISPLDFPRTFKKLVSYQSVILNNISWSDFLDNGKIQSLKEFVENGGKLFVIGGNSSFGFGDYMGTLLEELLPVKVNPSGLVSILFGVDNSGSMEDDINGVRKIDIAINSLLDIVKILEPEDEVGVHLYNKSSISDKLWIPLQGVESFAKELNAKIKKIPSPSGGTFIKPALETLVSKLLLTDKELRLIVLITDGESKEDNYAPILKKIVKSKPSIGFVLIGADVNESSLLLKESKQIFGSKWKMININEHGWVNLKDCFEEALSSITSGFSKEGTFDIFVNHNHPFMKSIKTFQQPFSGIILKTGLKEGASSLLDINDKYPLLAHWYFGSGEVMSFQSGYFQGWASSWLRSSQGSEYVSFLNSWLTKRRLHESKVFASNVKSGIKIEFSSHEESLLKQVELILEIGSHEFVLERSNENKWSVVVTSKKMVELLKLNEQRYYKVFKNHKGNRELFNEGILPIMPNEEMENVYHSNSLFMNISGVISLKESEFNFVKFKVEDVKKSFDESFFIWVLLFSFLGIILFRGRIH